MNLHSIGVGFSYADYGETIETTEDAAKNVHAFLAIFFETFSQFKGRPLHLAGESYGVSAICCWSSTVLIASQGRYLPAFASYVYDQNTIALAEGRDTLNMSSVIIGNGIVDIMMCVLGCFQVYKQTVFTLLAGFIWEDTKLNAELPRLTFPSRPSATAYI